MIYIYIVLSLVIFVNYFLIARKGLHILQLNYYNENNRYLKWIFKNLKTVFNYLDLLVIFNFVLIFLTKYEYYGLLLFVLILLYLFKIYLTIQMINQEQVKKPLVTTARIKRLWITLIIIYLASYLVLFIKTDYSSLVILLQSLFAVFAYFVVYIANVINIPVEGVVTYKFRIQAISKLKSMPSLKKVGITGSYGKTTSKNVLNEILNIKYATHPTKKSFNTYKGLMAIINNELQKFDQVFIAEMGAFVKGEIKHLTKFIKPQYGILTTVGTAHLESFGTRENIQQGKFELIEGLPSDGLGVLNKDDPYQVSYEIKNNVRIKWIAIKDKTADYYAEDIKNTKEGTTFNLRIKGDKKKYPFQTKLLGSFNVYNILAGIALGLEFNLTMEELQAGVKKVKPVEHRLELKKISNFYQLDDSYNSNPVGAKVALEVLEMMPGTKVVVTPGMIDLGEEEKRLNKQFGEQIAQVADYVILVGKKQTQPIYEGLLKGKFNKDKIVITNDVKTTFPLLSQLKEEKKDLYALFENDLPDSYNEKEN